MAPPVQEPGIDPSVCLNLSETLTQVFITGINKFFAKTVGLDKGAAFWVK